MTDMINVALNVVRSLGIPIFPCVETLNQEGKIAKRPYTKKGFKDATRDENQIRQWWDKYPNALIGVPTGSMSGLFVVDIDQSNEKNGEASFKALDISDPITCQTCTVSGGRHLIFKYPKGLRLGNTTNHIGDSIDTRADGGYVIWAGSKTLKGDYRYRPGYSPDAVGFADIPDLILEKLLGETPSKVGINKLSGAIKSGSRNDTLFREGVTLVHAGVSDESISDYLRERSQDCEHKLDDKELKTIQESALSWIVFNSLSSNLCSQS